MKKLCLVTLILCLFLDASSCKKAQEEPTPAMGKKVEKQSQTPMIEEEETMVEEGEESEAPMIKEGEQEENRRYNESAHE